MVSDKFDYDQAIADLEAKVNALQAALSSLRTAKALGALGKAAEGAEISAAASSSAQVIGGDAGVPTELPVGAFHGKSLPACIKLFLSAARRKQTIKDIATALREGGVESTSPNFEGVITGALNRLKDKAEVLRFKDGWALPEWYPASLRVNAAAGESKTKKKKKVAKKSRKAVSKETPAEAKPNEPAEQQAGTEQRIMELFKGGGELSSKDVTERLGMRSQTVTFILGKLAYKNILQKTPTGGFKMAAVN